MNKKSSFTAKSLFVRNLPKLTTNDDLINAFSDIGPIKRANVVTDEVSNNCIGVGYVTFAFDNDAEAALKRTVKVGDNVLKLKIANRKTDENPYNKNKKTLKNGEKWRNVARQKKGRIIIRNLSFKANENCLRDLFSKYGKINDIVIPEKNGKMRGFAFISFSNVNYATKAIKEMNAKKIVDRVVAIDYALPKKTFESKNESNDFDEDEDKELDELIELAKGTDKGKSKNTKEDDDEESSDEDDESIINTKEKRVDKNLSVKDKGKNFKKTINSDDDDDDESSEMNEEDSEIDEEEENNDSSNDDSDGVESDAAEENDDDAEEENDDDAEDEEESDDDAEDEEESDEEESDSISKKKQANKKSLKSDVNEEKTVFIRNVSFDATENGLQNLLKQFGPIKYCKICIDEETGHSKGTAFVKFEKQEDAKLCVNENKQLENEKFFLDGKKLEISIALSQEQLMKQQQLKKIKNRDKRNLYLSREGFIHPESNAAKDVSQRDLEKRLSLENRKRKLLQNLLYFVSRTRLCIHNLPPEVNDRELKNIFYKAVNDKSAKIIEARVMYNVNKLENKLTKSAGYGFIEFTEHRHALIALRNLNNNPSIFKPSQRPIVEFTIENLSALKRRKINKKTKKTQENNQDQENFNYEQLDKEIGEQSFMGFRARPMKESEKIQLPKMNRKLQEMKQKIKDLRKTKRAERKTKLRKKEKFLSLKSKHKNISEHRDYSEREKVAVVDTDEFETNYLKRKRNFDSESDEINDMNTVNPKKKQRWFN